jgi:hypothetical protein
MYPDPEGKLIKDPPDADPQHCNKGYNVLSSIYDVHHGYCVHFGTGTVKGTIRDICTRHIDQHCGLW